MVVWIYQVRFSDGTYETKSINVKARVEGLETFEEEKKRVIERIKTRYRKKGMEVELINLKTGSI